ncbi:MAG: ROK family protein [Acidobacteria bacterium]|nr:ROK family protein [Acidobacteriota bacterium]
MSSQASSNQHYIGVDLSAASVRAALVSADGQTAARREAALDPEGLTAQVARLVTELRDEAAGVEVAALGVGVPGLVNPQTGRVVISSDLPTVVRGDLQAELKGSTGLPVLVENDANAGAFGEYTVGAGRGSRNTRARAPLPRRHLLALAPRDEQGLHRRRHRARGAPRRRLRAVDD